LAVTSTTVATYPLTFRSRALEKTWGGRRLGEMFGKRLPRSVPIGETWEIWEGLRIANGTWRGQTLGDVVQQAPAVWLGAGASPRDPTAFPLLVKFLDAHEHLSVQVHPDDDYARRQANQPYGKCEMWYVLAADPDGAVYHGAARALDPDDLLAALQEGRVDEVVERVPVRPGDVLFNPPGTIHALGAGVVCYELQQSSDITYRLYDWNRAAAGGPPRPLHLDDGMAVADLLPPARHQIDPVAVPADGHQRVFLAACRYFAAERLTLGDRIVERPTNGRFYLWTVLTGEAVVRAGSGPSIRLAAGRSALLPANLDCFRLASRSATCVGILAYVPDLAADVVEPLRAAGLPDDQISQLGGDDRHSDLRQFLSRTER
jgi:mannose-6-phosphate isomerase